MADWWEARNSRPNGMVTNDELLENQNQQGIERLASKISSLKGIAIQLEEDSKQSPSFVDSVMSSLGNAEGLLTGSVQRFSHMVNTTHNNRRLMCYLIAAIVGIFIVFHYILSHISV